MKVAPLVIMLLLWAQPALAQVKTTLVDAPLDVKLATHAPDVQRLQSDFRQLLAKNQNLLVPTRSNWKAAITKLNRDDCDVRDQCLGELALAADVVYALYASVESTVDGDEVVATGRIVNQDGDQARETVRVSVKVAPGRPLTDSALAALRALLTKLEVNTLPPVLTRIVPPVTVAKVEPEVVSTPEPKVTVPETITQPVPSPAPSGRPALRTVLASVSAGLAAAGAISSAVLGVNALTARSTLPSDGHFTTLAQAKLQASVNQEASGALATGIATALFAVASGVLFSDVPLPVGLAVSPAGGSVVVQGRF